MQNTKELSKIILSMLGKPVKHNKYILDKITCKIEEFIKTHELAYTHHMNEHFTPIVSQLSYDPGFDQTAYDRGVSDTRAAENKILSEALALIDNISRTLVDNSNITKEPELMKLCSECFNLIAKSKVSPAEINKQPNHKIEAVAQVAKDMVLLKKQATLGEEAYFLIKHCNEVLDAKTNFPQIIFDFINIYPAWPIDPENEDIDKMISDTVEQLKHHADLKHPKDVSLYVKRSEMDSLIDEINSLYKSNMDDANNMADMLRKELKYTQETLGKANDKINELAAMVNIAHSFIVSLNKANKMGSMQLIIRFAELEYTRHEFIRLYTLYTIPNEETNLVNDEQLKNMSFLDFLDERARDLHQHDDWAHFVFSVSPEALNIEYGHAAKDYNEYLAMYPHN